MRQHRRQQTGEGLRVKARAFVEGMNERRREGFRTHVVEGPGSCCLELQAQYGVWWHIW